MQRLECQRAGAQRTLQECLEEYEKEVETMAREEARDKERAAEREARQSKGKGKRAASAGPSNGAGPSTGGPSNGAGPSNGSKKQKVQQGSNHGSIGGCPAGARGTGAQRQASSA